MDSKGKVGVTITPASSSASSRSSSEDNLHGKVKVSDDKAPKDEEGRALFVCLFFVFIISKFSQVIRHV